MLVCWQKSFILSDCELNSYTHVKRSIRVGSITALCSEGPGIRSLPPGRLPWLSLLDFPQCLQVNYWLVVSNRPRSPPCRIAADILNHKSRTADKRQSFFCVGAGLTTHLKTIKWNITQIREFIGFLWTRIGFGVYKRRVTSWLAEPLFWSGAVCIHWS